MPWNITKASDSTRGNTEIDIVYWTAMGVHSKIPVCCISFWVTTWINMTREERNPYFGELLQKIKEIKRDIEYIPCPLCFSENNFINIHKCKRSSKSCMKFEFQQTRNRIKKNLENNTKNS